jgi:integrase
MKGKTASFRVGKVRAYRRAKVWYLQHYEGGQRWRPRVGPDRDLARQMAAQINGQLEVGAPAALSFEPVSIPELRERWLDHHENVRRSSVQTIRRYRAATQHLINFLQDVRPVRLASDFRSRHAEEFVRYLRSTKVAPNGHPKARKRLLRDSGIKFILETCSSLFNYAQRCRHLSPYAENPFRTIEVSRMPVEDFRSVIIFTEQQEQTFFKICDDWQFPLFLTLLLTGMRPGELTHLLLPDDLDLGTGWLHIRNKPQLGWQVKTRNERDIPLVPILVNVLRAVVGDRATGPVFRQRRFSQGSPPPLAGNIAEVGILDEMVDQPDGFQIRRRALSRRRTTTLEETSMLAKADGVIEGHVELPEKWVDEAIFKMPELTSWAEEYAIEVAERRLPGADRTVEQLCVEFGKTPPTIRSALRHAAEMDERFKDLPKKMSRAR